MNASLNLAIAPVVTKLQRDSARIELRPMDTLLLAGIALATLIILIHMLTHGRRGRRWAKMR